MPMRKTKCVQGTNSWSKQTDKVFVYFNFCFQHHLCKCFSIIINFYFRLFLGRRGLNVFSILYKEPGWYVLQIYNWDARILIWGCSKQEFTIALGKTALNYTHLSIASFCPPSSGILPWGRVWGEGVGIVGW